MAIKTVNTAVDTFKEVHGRLADLLQVALEMEHRNTVHRIRMECLKKTNMGQDLSTVFEILDAEDERPIAEG